MTQCDRRRLSGAAGSVSSLQTHTYKECLNTQNVCCSALKCPTGITRNMCKVQNYTFVCFSVYMRVCILCDCDIDFPPRPGSYLFSEVRRQFYLYAFVRL